MLPYHSGGIRDIPDLRGRIAPSTSSPTPSVEDGSGTASVAPLYFEFGINYLIEVYFPPTYSFGEKLFLQKGTVPRDKRFALSLVVEGVSYGFPRIPYKDDFLRFRFEFVGL